VLSLILAPFHDTITTIQEGEIFAQHIWNYFLGGSSTMRPFGDAVLDGVDFYLRSNVAIHSGMVAAIVSKLRSLMNTGNQQYYISGNPYTFFFLPLTIA